MNFRGAQMSDRFVFSEDGRPVGHQSSWNGAMQPFIFSDPRFPMPTPPLIRLFELITRPNNEFEKHIIRCAEWTGQAIGEPNDAAALVKAAIALEVLFSANEKGLITPSIMAQIAGPPEQFSVDARTFWKSELELQVGNKLVHEMFAVTIQKGYVLSFMFAGPDIPELDKLAKTMGSLRFTDSSH